MNRSALSPRALWSMTKESVVAWVDDFAPSMGASIAYYTVFSIAPLLLIVIAIAGAVWGHEAASGYLYSELAGILGREETEALQAMVASASSKEQGLVATIVGVVLLMIGATTVFAELQSDLDRIWKAPAIKESSGLWGLIRSRILSLGLVASIGFLMMVSFVVSVALAAFAKWWGGAFASMEWLFHLLDTLLSFAVVTALFALVYKILPRVAIAWRDVWIGAAVTALLFAIGKFAVGVYIGKAGVASSFGAASTLAVLLVWVYYSAQIFLIGAELTWVYAHRFGSRQGKDMPASVRETLATTRNPDPAASASAEPPAEPVVENRKVRTSARDVIAVSACAFVVGAIAGRLLHRDR
jgi:membrane protein